MVFFLRLTFVIFWFCICCFFGTVLSLFFWKHRKLTHFIGVMFGSVVLKICNIKCNVEGEAYLSDAQPCVFVGNHQTAFDVVLFGRIYPRSTVSIGKKEVLWIPFFGILFIATNNIIIKRQNRKSSLAGLSKATQAIKEKNMSILIFPEGTRNKKGDEPLLPFKKGAFHMAIEAQVPIVPMVCSSTRSCVSLSRRLLGSAEINMKILPPIETKGMKIEDVELLLEKIRTQMIQTFTELKTNTY